MNPAHHHSRKPLDKIKAASLLFVLIAVMLLAAGATITYWTVIRADRIMRREMLLQARIMSEAIQPEYVMALTGTESDLESSAYDRVKTFLMLVQQSSEKLRFIYLLGRKDSGEIFFFLDSESPHSAQYSPPGEIFDEAEFYYQDLFNHYGELVEGPVADRWGAWISALVPITDPASGTVIALLGMDISAHAWHRDLVLASLPPVAVTAALLFLLFTGAALFRMRTRATYPEKRWLRFLEQEMAALVGIILTLYGTHVSLQSESFSRESTFSKLAISQTSTVAQELSDIRFIGLEGLASFFKGSEHVTPEEFSLYAAHLTRNLAVKAWGWVPEVTASDRALFEGAAQNNISDNYTLWEMDSSGIRKPAATRTKHYPLLYVAPLPVNEFTLGYDFASDPICSETFESAALERLPMASEPISLFHESSPNTFLLVCRPVFSRPAQGVLLGFAVAIIDVRALLETTYYQAGTIMAIALLEESGSAYPLASELPGTPALANRLALVRPVDAYGKTIVIAAYASDAFLAANRYYTSLLAFLTGILCTSALVFILTLVLRRREVLERLVAERTASLLKSEAMHKVLVDGLPDIILRFDQNGCFLFVSESASRIFAETASEFIGKTPHELNFPQDICTFWDGAVQDVIKDRQTIEGELTFTGSGTQQIFNWRMVPEFADADAPKTVLAIGRDITKQKKTEQDYQMLFQKMSNGFTLCEIVFDAAGQPVDFIFVGVNPAFESITGLTTDAIIGKSFVDVFPEFGPAPAAVFANTAQTGAPCFVERYFSSLDKHLAVTVFRASPEQLAFLFEDISKRKIAETALQKREKLLNRIFEMLPVGLWVTDKEGCIIRSNPAGVAIWGGEIRVPASEYAVFKAWRLPSREPVLPEQWAVARTLREGTTVTDELLEIETFEGQRKIILNYSAPILDENGAIDGVIVLNLDVTERNMLEEQLRQSQKMEAIGRLAGGIAHDFNNMLGVIIGNADMVLDTLSPDDLIHEDLAEIRKAAERSADLTRQLLAFARKQTVSPQAIDLNETVTASLKMLQRLIGEDIHLVWRPGDALRNILMDPVQIDQILVNLFLNARDAMNGAGTIIIETKAIVLDALYCEHHIGCTPGAYIQLAVSDTGCGIPKKYFPKLFEPFFTTKEIGKGTGLGLPTVYGIVKQNKGFINVYSEEGQGTCIKLYLPEYTSEKKSSVAARYAGAGETIEKTVLLVEDEKAVLRMSVAMLKKLGYTVVAAQTPGEAIQFAREHDGDIHLLMTDVIMPEMNGRDLAINIISLYPRIKRLFMSGYTDEVIAHHGVLDQGVNFIQKPFTIHDLDVKLREIFRYE